MEVAMEQPSLSLDTTPTAGAGEAGKSTRSLSLCLSHCLCLYLSLCLTLALALALALALTRTLTLILTPTLTLNQVFGLAWDVTDGVNIDLDASAIMLSNNGGKLALIDLVYFGKLVSSDGSIRHCGDQRTGAAAGDDEQIVLNLPSVHPSVYAIGIVINSYSGQVLLPLPDAIARPMHPPNAATHGQCQRH